MMLIVEIRINEKVFYRGTARRLSPKEYFMPPNTRCRYVLDNGKEITHRYGDGAKKLAIRILKEGLGLNGEDGK